MTLPLSFEPQGQVGGEDALGRAPAARKVPARAHQGAQAEEDEEQLEHESCAWRLRRQRRVGRAKDEQADTRRKAA